MSIRQLFTNVTTDIKEEITMDKVNFGLAKFLQFIIIVFFAFVLAFYFGALLLIPLAILIAVVDILTAIGFNGIVATIVAIPVVGWICYVVYKIPNLFQALLDTGIKLYEVGTAQNKVFESISVTLKPAPTESSTEESANAASETTQKAESSEASESETPSNVKPA